MNDDVVTLSDREKEPFGRERVYGNEIRGHHRHDVVIQRHMDIRVDCNVDQTETIFLVLRDRDLVVAASIGSFGFTVDKNIAEEKGLW